MEHRFYMTHSCISNEYLVVCTYFKKDLTDLLQVCMMYSGGKITKKCNLEKMGCLFFEKNVLPATLFEWHATRKVKKNFRKIDFGFIFYLGR